MDSVEVVEDRVILDSNMLLKLCANWARILNLDVWEIQVNIVRGCDMPGGDTNLGSIAWNLAQAKAVISILDPIDIVNSFSRDMESDLLHELLHLHFAPFDKFKKDSLEDIMLERAINMIVESLLTVARKEGRKWQE